MATFGEQVVRTTFNPSSSSEVDEIKKAFAILINTVAAVGAKHSSSRSAARAMELLETAAMYAVKAATGADPPLPSTFAVKAATGADPFAPWSDKVVPISGAIS